MRIVILDTYYPPFLLDHYARRPELRRASYAEQHRALMERAFGTSDAYSRNLRLLGHDATEVVVNCVPAQRAWAGERGRSGVAAALAALPERGRIGRVVGSLSGALHRVALDQIGSFEPDVVYLQDIRFHTPKQIEDFRGANRRFVAGQTASREPTDAQLAALDLVLTSFPHYVERFERKGVRSAYLRLGFDGEILDRIDPRVDRAVDVVFVGGLDRRVHGEGVALLETVCAALGDAAAVYGYGASSLPADSSVLACYRGEAWGLEMYEALSSGRIALNRHIATAEGFANNMRLFEATGVGTALLTESAPNLAQLFEPGVEVATYERADDVIGTIEHLLADRDSLARLASAGQRRTLTEHTFGVRMAELVNLLELHLAAGRLR
ncbi:MAG: glycosyltransferase family protein [Gaiellaceae bacterium]